MKLNNEVHLLDGGSGGSSGKIDIIMMMKAEEEEEEKKNKERGRGRRRKRKGRRRRRRMGTRTSVSNNGNKCHHHETKLGCLPTNIYNQFHLLCIPTQPTYI
jgi:hypothetical protein